MATLRKACRNCASSKRKCTVQAPQCTRCAQKGLKCVYDLEPLNAPAAREASKLSYNPSHDINSGYCVMKTLEPRASSVPGVCRPDQADVLEQVRLGFHSVQELIGKGKPAVFVHPGLHVRGCHNHLAALSETGSGGIFHPGFNHLLQIDIETVPIQEALTALQALLVHLVMSLFASDPAEQASAELHLGMLSGWTRALLVSARPRSPLIPSPWQAWLFGESVRRTIVMSHVLALAHFSLKNRYCSNCLFFESLPFDGRLGLWMAESPQAWIAAARVKAGEDVGEQLSSFHEFAESLDGTTPELCGDTFLALLAIGHNGRVTNLTYGN